MPNQPWSRARCRRRPAQRRARAGHRNPVVILLRWPADPSVIDAGKLAAVAATVPAILGQARPGHGWLSRSRRDTPGGSGGFLGRYRSVSTPEMLPSPNPVGSSGAIVDPVIGEVGVVACTTVERNRASVRGGAVVGQGDEDVLLGVEASAPVITGVDGRDQ
jgi:hypothetical protein